MNLHNIAAGALTSINPWLRATIQSSTGYETTASGSRVPTYDFPYEVLVKKQAMQYQDLVQLDGVNIQGEKCILYMSGAFTGMSRADGKGGDLITLPDGKVWLVVQPLEDWNETSGWCKLACTRQKGAS